MNTSTATLPQLDGTRFVTDGGMETDLIFHHGVDLPEFAAFPLLDDPDGRELLTNYYDGYAAIARHAGVGLMLETPTWRANPDWGARLGYAHDDLARIDADAVGFLQDLRASYAERSEVGPILVSGMIGPRGDGYVSEGAVEPAQAADYHLPQLRAFTESGADLATALTLTDVGEATGIVQAAHSVGLPIAIGLTVETDGRLPDGTTIGAAISAVDQVAAPDYFLINCAHPTHVANGLTEPGEWTHRIVGTRVNASPKSHAELDEAEQIDEGDIAQLVVGQAALEHLLPALAIVGGCCGTDHRHVGALWGVPGRAR